MFRSQGQAPYVYRHRYLIILLLFILNLPLAVFATFIEIPTGLPNVSNGSTAWGDYDNDGDLDVLITGRTSINYPYNEIARIYRNDGNNVFTNIQAGIQGVQNSSVAWGDYDKDGDLDIALTGYYYYGSSGQYTNKISSIYRNDGNNVFTDIQAGLQLVTDGKIYWGDYDNDGDLDIFLIGSYSNPGWGTVNFTVYHNEGNGRFTQLIISAQQSQVTGSGMGDYDNDGDLDIFLSNYYYSPHGPVYSTIYRNDGNTTFSPIPIVSQQFNIYGYALGDYDNDGDLDMLINGSVFRNDRNGIFTDIHASLLGGNFSVWTDFDNDGRLDIVVTGSDYTRVYHNNGNSTFTDIEAGLQGISYISSLSSGDYDNDGDLDIMLLGTMNESYVTKIYRNDSTVANTAPSAPTNLRTRVVGNYVNFEWDAPIDAQTPTMGLNYALRIGTTPGGSEISASMANSAGYKLIPEKGYANTTSWKIQGTVFPANNYYWSVQAIDTAFSGSAFGTEVILQTLQVLAPNGGEIWQVNTPITVYWSAIPSVNEVNVMLSLNNGTSWIWLNTNPISAALGQFSFTVPYSQSTNCRIKVVNAVNGSVYDTSDNSFTIRTGITPRVALTAPTNAKLQAGMTYNINWTASSVTHVKLEFSLNAGVNWNTIISSVSATSCSYAWVVPEVSSATCHLRISDASNPEVYDLSDAPFTICILRITSPNGGNMFQNATTRNIEWVSAHISNVWIEYSVDNGTNWDLIPTPISATIGSYNWTIPNSISTQCLIRISEVGSSQFTDTSDNAFSIVMMTVLYPSTTGIRIQNGRVRNITWEQQNLTGTVKLEMTQNEGATFTTIATGVNAATGSYEWTIPETPSINWKIKITSEQDAQVWGYSNNSFSISTLEITSPNGGEVWGSGSTHLITLIASCTDRIYIEYSTDGGINWHGVGDTYGPGQWTYSNSSFNWTVPQSNSDNCLVRIYAADVGPDAGNDVSNAPFTIRPQITITAPNGGEMYTVWNLVNIQWTNTLDVANVRLDYSIDGGSNWLPIQTSAYPANFGSYDWIVPNAPSTSCLIRVKSYTNESFYDVSDAYFSITPLILPPVVDFMAFSTEGIEPFEVMFSDQSMPVSGDIISWLWDFGDGITSVEQNPQHTYMSAGTYTVSLTVTNSYDSTSVLVKPNYIQVIPSYAEAVLLSSPAMNFGVVYPGMQSLVQPVWIKNTGTIPLAISSISFQQSSSQFSLANSVLPMQIAVGDSGYINMRFIPNVVAIVNDIVYIHNNSANLPLLSVSLTGMSEYIAPQAPSNVAIAMDINDAHISWDAVIETIHHTPIIPDSYLVFFNGSGDPDGLYYFLGATTGLNYTHSNVGLYSPYMFYRVRAIKNYGTIRDAAILRSLSSDMTESEVLKKLDLP